MFLPVRIRGTGVALPAVRVTADELDARLGLPAGSSFARNGVRVRHFANEQETSSALSVMSIQCALNAAGMQPDDLDAILYASVMSEQPLPPTAALIHQRLGCRIAGMECYDINASCAGFLKEFEIAAHAIFAGTWRNVAIVATELASKGLNWDDTGTCTLFGDGSGAAILSRAEPDQTSGILAMRSATVSEGFDLCTMKAGGSRFNMVTPPPSEKDYLFAMNGRGLLRLIEGRLPAFIGELLADTAVEGEPLSVIVPHQASAIGLAYLRKLRDSRPDLAGVPIVEILPEMGNQVTASLAVSLHHAVCRGMLRRGQKALLIGTAAGLAMSGMVIRY